MLKRTVRKSLLAAVIIVCSASMTGSAALAAQPASKSGVAAPAAPGAKSYCEICASACKYTGGMESCDEKEKTCECKKIEPPKVKDTR